MTPSEIQQTEDLINEWILEQLPLTTQVMDIEEAKLTGATALFGEKYDEKVRVVSIGNDTSGCISKEFCGGTHASNTGDLRLIKILSESAISAGVRRIEAVVSSAALNYLNAKAKEIDKLSARFKVHYDEVEARVDKLAEENKELQKQVHELKEENARSKFAAFITHAKDIDGGKLFITKTEITDAEAIKAGAEYLASKLGESIIILVNNRLVFVRVSDGFVKAGVNAGKIVGEISRACGANGGGRPNMAQGGIKDFSNIDSILAGVESSLMAPICK